MNITQSKFVISNTDVTKCPKGKLPEYAFIGRSNVGKSSLINMLADRKKLAMTSSSPGKTMLINHFLMNDNWHLVDLPGYGYAKRGKSMRESFGKMITEYMRHREQLTTVFVLIDIRHKPQAIDIEFINWMGEEEVPMSIIFTKADKLPAAKAAVNVELFKEELALIWEEMPPMFISSATKRKGKEDILDYIDSINKEIANSSK